MELEQSRPFNPAMTFDEVSMERSKSFVKALQELKNLRPQLYSAAEYCEKSYLHSEQKQMVLDNLKDYAVRALVNAVDHLGTVAYKLTDLLDQQTLDVSNMDLKVTCLNQKLLTCKTFMDKEGSRQQQLLSFIPRHHKHYILPNSVNKKVHFSPHLQTDTRQHAYQARPHVQPSTKTLSWHLASETKSTLKGTSHGLASSADTKVSVNTSGTFQLLDNEGSATTKSSGAHVQLPSQFPGSETFVAGHRDAVDGYRPLGAARSFDNQNRQIVRVPVRSKSLLSAFFVKQKSTKLKTRSVS
ncbi:putative ABI family protein [Rosa chinensis]|uniref:Putative ABI family protein n=1 Tax=Rosa chinensis TaxID=74649 RepID=A0A2P6SI41_ROSCH|nr:protein ABIL1 isoform X2 [Rosa chinensis]PRQ58344.1 putative ABI family protein [Rosa chinensis]